MRMILPQVHLRNGDDGGSDARVRQPDYLLSGAAVRARRPTHCGASLWTADRASGRRSPQLLGAHWSIPRVLSAARCERRSERVGAGAALLGPAHARAAGVSAYRQGSSVACNDATRQGRGRRRRLAFERQCLFTVGLGTGRRGRGTLSIRLLRLPQRRPALPPRGKRGGRIDRWVLHLVTTFTSSK